MDPAAIQSNNLRHMMRFFAGATAEGEVREMPGVSIVSSGLDFGALNSAIFSEQVTGAAELERRLDMAEVHFRTRGLRWSCWVCEDTLDGPLRRKAKEIFLKRGYRLLTEAPGMLAERLTPPSRPLPAIDVRRVADPASRFDFAHAVSVCFELPLRLATCAYTQASSWECGVEGYVGYVNGRAVSTIAIAVAADAIGVYSVATLPDVRKRGYAEALMRWAIAETEARTGIARTVLQSSRDGLALYERMGYRAVTKFWLMLR
jgi:GNAT superfamily N-acetyltransferase